MAGFDPKVFIQLTDSMTGYSTKLSRTLTAFDNYVINKALSTAGIPTATLTSYLGTFGGGLLGGGCFSYFLKGIFIYFENYVTLN